MSVFVALHGPDNLLELFNQVQPNIWTMLLEQVCSPRCFCRQLCSQPGGALQPVETRGRKAAPARETWRRITVQHPRLQVWVPGLSTVQGGLKRKACGVALVKFVCECTALRDPSMEPMWNGILAAVVPLLESAATDAVEDEFGLEEMTGHTAFSRLQNVPSSTQDPLAAVADAKQYFVTSLAELSKSIPGQTWPQFPG